MMGQTIMGLDISQGNPYSRREARYAVVVLDEESKVIEKHELASLGKIVRLAWDFRPKIIALDNIFEIGGDQRGLARIVGMLPEDVEVVQTTIVDGEFKELKEVAKSFGIELQGKLTPLKTAYLNAYIASKGGGTKVRLVEEKTKIVISRGRALGPGGMSQNRYKRHLRGLVLRVAKQVKEKLDSHGFDYDMIIRRSKAGLEGAQFVVYAPRESLYGIIKRMKGHDVVLDIRPVYKSKVELIGKNRESPNRALIVGIDPGIEVGISAIDVYGRPILLVKRRSIDREEIISMVSEYGKPVVVSTDVSQIPEAVRKFAAQFGARLYVPDKPMSVDEKQNMVASYSERYGIRVDDPHIRDSLAAALRAYNGVESKIRQIDGKIRRLGLDIQIQDVFSCVIKGQSISDCLERRIEEIIQSQAEEEVPAPNKIEQRLPQTNQRQAEEVAQTKREVQRLKSIVKSLIQEKRELESKLLTMRMEVKRDVVRDREIYTLKNEIESRDRALRELERKVIQLEGKISEFNRVVRTLVEGKAVVIRGGNSLIRVEGNELRILGQRVSEDILLYRDRDLLILEAQTIQDLELLRREMEASHSEDVDLTKLIRDYRESRKDVYLYAEIKAPEVKRQL